MRNLFSKTLLFVALGILLMHTIVPHYHAEDSFQTNSIHSEKKPFGIIQMIQTVVSKDQGERHLDYFSPGTLELSDHIQHLCNDFEEFYLSRADLPFILRKYVPQFLQFRYTSKIISDFYKYSNGKRGPPTLF